MPHVKVDPDASIPTLRLAATVLLLRDGPEGVEILMLRRHAQMHFGDAWVFPGGTVDSADYDAATLAQIDEAQRARCAERLASGGAPAGSMEMSVALHVAACREIFEETGILLAHCSDGGVCSAAQVARLQSLRNTAAEPGAFVQLIARENLRLDLDRFVYWSHWITPVGAPKRFDTRFFAVKIPAGQSVVVDARESSDSVWVRPHLMTQALHEGKGTVLPPTRITLLDLAATTAKHGSVAATLAAESRRHAIAIMPKTKLEGDRRISLYPWDPEYSAVRGEGVEFAGEPPAQLRDLPSRFIWDIPKK